MPLNAPELNAGNAVELFISKGRFFGDGWARLPKWASYFIRLGAQVANEDGASHGPITLVVVVPTRAFGALLCSVGVVLRLFESPPQIDPLAQFALLKLQPLGTKVTYYTSKGNRIPGALVECNEQGIVVKPSVGAAITIQKSFSNNVELSGGLRVGLPAHATSKSPQVHDRFVETLFGPQLVTNAQVPSRLDCGIVGTESLLRAEIQGARLGIVESDGSVIGGSFQQLLLLRGYSPESNIFRSDVLSAVGKRQAEVGANVPIISVFDGAASFLKRGTRWATASRIVLLDRTERCFDEAIAELRKQFVQRNCDGIAPQKSLAGVETLSFRSRRA